MESCEKKRLVIIGANGHGKVVADIAVKNGYKDIVFLDDDDEIQDCAGFPVVGNTKQIGVYQQCDYFVAIGNAKTRKKFIDQIPDGNLITLIHPSATISRRVLIDKASVVMAGAIINSDAVIGKGCIINTGASVDHDCVVGDYSHISVGAHIAGTVVIDRFVWVGAGATVRNNVSIVSDSIIGAGAVVVKDIDKSGTYIGVPAKKVK